MEISKAFGKTLRRIRDERGLTRERLAELAEVEYTFVYLLENGRRQPTLTTIFLLARALKIAPSKFIAEVEMAKPTYSGRGEKPTPAASKEKPAKKMVRIKRPVDSE